MLTSCAPQAAAERPPNVVFLTVDSLRADHTSLLGYHRPTTPQLERLARDAVVYTKAQAQASWTLPSYTSIFTGRWSSDLARLHHLEGRMLPGSEAENYDNPFGIPENAPTIASLLKESGYGFATVGHAANPNLSLDFNFGLGFDEFDPKSGAMVSQIVDRALAALDELADGDEPFYLFVHFEQAHYPFPSTPPFAELWKEDDEVEPKKAFINVLMSRNRMVRERQGQPALITSEEERLTLRRQVTTMYDRAIAEVDAGIGEILDALRSRGLYDDALIVVNADHGEEFGDHGAWGHGHTLLQELLHVPLVVKYPAVVAPGRVDRPVSNIDVLPTILGVVGLDAEASWIHGRDLHPARARWDAHPFPVSEGGPDHAIGKPGLLAIRGPRYKLVYSFDDPEPGLRGELAFDLEEDPAEEHPLPDGAPEVDHLRRRLDAWLAVHRVPLDPSALGGKDSEPQLGEETLRELRELGYIGGD